jgi:hypothetical protein
MNVSINTASDIVDQGNTICSLDSQNYPKTPTIWASNFIWYDPGSTYLRFYLLTINTDGTMVATNTHDNDNNSFILPTITYLALN